MVPVEGKDLLRIAILSGMLGFACFCVSYGIYVWRRRNSSNSRPKSRATRAAQALVLLGILGVALSWAMNEFQGRTGIAGGSDLFVVNARQESASQQITSADTVEQGDVVAEFLSASDRTRLAAIDLQQAQARAKIKAIQSEVLQFDQALLQEQAHLRAALLQFKDLAFELRRSRLEIERDRADLLITWTREDGKLLEEIALAESELTTATGHRELTRRALQRGQVLLKRNDISQQVLDDRRAEHLSAQQKVEKLKNSITSLEDRQRALEQRFHESNASFEHHISELADDLAEVKVSILSLETRNAEINHQLDEDRKRAIASRAGEIEAVGYDITILSAERDRLTQAGQVRAPFAGQVVYRDPAPGLASESSPVLAISAGTGFTAKVRLPSHEVDELAAQGQDVQLALDNPVLHRFFTGRFVRAEPVPFEPNRVIAYFDCSLPPEIVSYLGSTADPVRVRLLWRPSLSNQLGFQASLLILAVSIPAFAWGARRTALRPTSLAHLGRVENGSQSNVSDVGIDDAWLEGDLRLLAVRFRQQLRRQQLEPELLAKVERMLDRDRAQAACILGEEVPHEIEFGKAAVEWMGRQDERTRRRLAIVLQKAGWPVLNDAVRG
jgi:HlyD family secretion protein